MAKDANDQPIDAGDIVKILKSPTDLPDRMTPDETEFAKSLAGKSAIIDDIVDGENVRVYLYDELRGAIQYFIISSKNLTKRLRIESPRLRLVRKEKTKS